MLHASDKIRSPAEHLKSLLKLFPMFKTRIWYDESIGNEDIPEAVGIMRINCGKSIGCSLDNQIIEHFMTPFVTNTVFQHVGLSWIIKSNQKLKFYLQLHSIYWEIYGQLYITMIFSQLNVLLFDYYDTTAECVKNQLMCSIEAHERWHKSVND